MQTSASTVIARPVDEVWAALADHRRISGWAPGLRVEVDDTAATAPGEVGAVRRIEGGPGPAIVERITAFVPGRRLGYEAVSGIPFRDYAGTIELTVRGLDATEVRWTLTASPRVPVLERLALAGVNRVLLTLFARATRRG
ncbi:SRPBCC family protein [Nocardioides sp. ChNu-153]|uniref:SRPBCC family protein n=1 Tax=unclassified Nocardioides TaxID=2615069 RepID=UPI0024051363|nr:MULTISPECIES: SRPBCC family protein [unclassified Nocardioides]MDF9716166.1 SRPBCC family protein [Nocardioides sp. ChNu-99]MDN7121556.1 SRPBCC family protein [Nocardioides sp. ChNu-153]